MKESESVSQTPFPSHDLISLSQHCFSLIFVAVHHQQQQNSSLLFISMKFREQKKLFLLWQCIKKTIKIKTTISINALMNLKWKREDRATTTRSRPTLAVCGVVCNFALRKEFHVVCRSCVCASAVLGNEWWSEKCCMNRVVVVSLSELLPLGASWRSYECVVCVWWKKKMMVWFEKEGAYIVLE